MSLNNFLDMIGFSQHEINYKEKLISTAGGFLGIFAIFRDCKLDCVIAYH